MSLDDVVQEKQPSLSEDLKQDLKNYPSLLWKNTKLFTPAFVYGSIGAAIGQTGADYAGIESPTALNIIQYVSATIPGYGKFFRDLYTQNQEEFPDGAFNSDLRKYIDDSGAHIGDLLSAKLKGEELNRPKPKKPTSYSPLTPEYGRAVVDFLTFDYVADAMFYTPEQVYFHDMLLDEGFSGPVRGALANAMAATTYTVFGTGLYAATKRINDRVSNSISQAKQNVVIGTKLLKDSVLQPFQA